MEHRGSQLSSTREFNTSRSLRHTQRHDQNQNETKKKAQPPAVFHWSNARDQAVTNFCESKVCAEIESVYQQRPE